MKLVQVRDRRQTWRSGAYLEGKDEREDNGTEVGSGERQPWRREEMIDVVHRTHDRSERGQEEKRPDGPPNSC